MTDVTVRCADLDDPKDADAVLQMTRAYSQDPMGGGKDLAEDVRASLIGKMKEHPATVSLLAWDGDDAIGVANCFLSFSTFRARPVLNVHDFAVTGNARGKGVGRKMMSAVEDHARSLGCIAVTLEVYGKNHHARDVYHAMGFSNARETSEEDLTIFCHKML